MLFLLKIDKNFLFVFNILAGVFEKRKAYLTYTLDPFTVISEEQAGILDKTFFPQNLPKEILDSFLGVCDRIVEVREADFIKILKKISFVTPKVHGLTLLFKLKGKKLEDVLLQKQIQNAVRYSDLTFLKKEKILEYLADKLKEEASPFATSSLLLKQK
jgi:hypothetical protein